MASAKGWGGAQGRWLVAAVLASLLAGFGIGRLWPGDGPGDVFRPSADPAPRPPAPGPKAVPAAAAPRAGAVPDDDDNDINHTREVEGPWGRLRYVGIWLFPPLQTVNPAHCLSVLPPWRFPGVSRGDLERVLAVPDLDPAVRADLLKAARCDAGGCVVAATPDLARGLSPGARTRIYGFQVQQPDNDWALLTQRLTPADFDLWLSQADLPAAVVDRIRGLSFPLGEYRAVADLPLLCGESADDAARANLFRAWSFDRALMAKVRMVKGRDDPDRLAAYWAYGGRRKDLREVFTAAVRSDDVIYIDLAHLLPLWARGRLNTYPLPEHAAHNCYWTAVNFHRSTPDQTPLAPSDLDGALRKDFVPVTDGSRRFGDIDLYQVPGGAVLHASVHLADGVAYTKNGGSVMKPWILAREEDLVALYASQPGSRILHYRYAKP